MAAVKEKATSIIKERTANLLFQETSILSLRASVTLQSTVFVKAADSKLFLVYFFFIPKPSFSCPPLPLLFTPLQRFIILRRALLTSETPLCTQVLLKAHSSPHQLVRVWAPVRVHVCVRACWSLSEGKPKRWIDSVWQTGLVIQYFKWPSTPSTPTRPGPNSKLLSV